jgi:hypothetical protein
VLVTDHECVPQWGWNGASGGAVIQDRRAAGHHDPVHGAVTEESGHRWSIECRSVDHVATTSLDQVIELNHDVDMRPVPAAGVVLLMVEKEPTDVDEGIGPLCSGMPGDISDLVGVASRRAAATTDPPSASSQPSTAQRSSMVRLRCSDRSGSAASVGSGWFRSSQAAMALLTPATVSGIS